MISGDEFEEPDVELAEDGAGDDGGAGVGEGVGLGVGELVVSTTVTLKWPMAEFPAVSVAKQLTSVVPIGKVEPEAGEQITETVGSTLSVAEAEKVTAAPAGPVAGVVMSAGNVRVGGVVSVVNVPLVQPLTFPVQAGADWTWIVVLAGSASSMPYLLLLLNAPPLINRLDPGFPLTNTPEPMLLTGPGGSVPLLLATTLSRVTMFALVMEIPFPSLLVAVTFVSVTLGALRVAPLELLLEPDFLLSVKDESFTVIAPLSVVAENPALFVLLPSKVPFETVIFPESLSRSAVLCPPA